MATVSTAHQAIRWHLNRLWGIAFRRMGTQGLLVGVAALLTAASLWGRHTMHQDWKEHRRAQETRLSLPAPPLATVPDAKVLTLEALARFEARLPQVADVPQKVADLFEIAAAQKLTLMRGEYKWQADDRAIVQRYQMSLPVRGDADAIQNFIRLAMIELPTLSFEAIQFKRERIDSRTVEARLQWSLLVRQGDAPQHRNAPRPAKPSTGVSS